jgi:phage/plasmid-like protein (TIGR03299 family)
MSHEIETMAYAGETPWHGLGKLVPADLSPEQMLEAADLNWEVEKKDLYFFGDDEEADTAYLAPGKKALIRKSDGAILDMVGDDWNPLQNADAFEFFNDFVVAGGMEMHTAGSLFGGKRVWALAKINEPFEIFKDDVIEPYLLFSNPHQYGKSIDVRTTQIRVVCNNTLTFALGKEVDRGIRVGHRAKFDADKVKMALGVIRQQSETYKAAGVFLGSKKAKDELVTEYFDRLFPLTSNKEYKEKKYSRATVTSKEILHTQPGAQYGAGTWWGCFNAVTFMSDHILGCNPDNRLESAWFGPRANLKQNALKLAIEYAEAA